MAVETILEDAGWDAVGLEALAVRAVDATMLHLGLVPADWEVSLLGCSDARIAVLNTDFRGKATATNVLSWPSQERAPDGPGGIPALPETGGDTELGDIAIALETCQREAAAADKPVQDHVTHLLVHGCLHLLGYDHVDDADAELMEKTEADVLATLGLSDPYSI